MDNQDTAKNWNKLVARKLDANNNADPSKTRELANTMMDSNVAEQWLAWQPHHEERGRLQAIVDCVGLLLNQDAAKWPLARDKLAQKCRGDAFPWLLLQQGLADFIKQPSANPAYKTKFGNTKSPKKTTHTSVPKIAWPTDPKKIWLAIGDETGSWDYESHPGNRNNRGLALVLGRLDSWQRAFGEQINGLSVEQRMCKPLQNLPESCTKSNFHHGKDAFDLGVKGVPPDLLAELQANLGWLAGHPDLITIGFSASYKELHLNFSHSQDASIVLAKAYALLLAYVFPFLHPSDVLLLGFETRSEQPDSIAATRSDFTQKLNGKNDRADMDMRGFLSMLRDTLIGDLNKHWPDGRAWSEQFDLAMLTKLVRDPRLNLAQHNNSAWKGLADLGASLLKVRQEDSDWSRQFQFTSLPNVRFFSFAELSK